MFGEVTASFVQIPSPTVVLHALLSQPTQRFSVRRAASGKTA